MEPDFTPPPGTWHTTGQGCEQATARILAGSLRSPCSCLPSNATPTPQSWGHLQYLWWEGGRASPRSAVPRALPGKAVVGRWTWLRVVLQAQKPLEAMPAFGSSQTPTAAVWCLGKEVADDRRIQGCCHR